MSFLTSRNDADKQDWWNKSKVQGPVIEQATHICKLDIASQRSELTFQVTYRDTSVVISISIPSRKPPIPSHGIKLKNSAHAVEAHEKPGVLSKKNFDESVIPDEQRIPRATSANW